MNSKFTSFFKLFRERNKNINKSDKSDAFIIKYRQNNKHREDDMIDIRLLDQRRLVFISLIGLYQSWRKCPSVKLYNSLFVLPLKQKWIYKPSKYARQLQTHCMYIFRDSAETKEFIHLLKWKDSQNLVLWTLDYDYETSCDSKSQKHKTDELVHPFWYFLSDKLSNLYNPITRNKYNSLQLDGKVWRETQNYIQILAELYLFRQKYDAMKEIILQSNPNSLRPVVSYTINDENHEISIKTNDDLFDDEFDSDENKQDWWISDDYDPYDTKDDMVWQTVIT